MNCIFFQTLTVVKKMLFLKLRWQQYNFTTSTYMDLLWGDQPVLKINIHINFLFLFNSVLLGDALV